MVIFIYALLFVHAQVKWPEKNWSYIYIQDIPIPGWDVSATRKYHQCSLADEMFHLLKSFEGNPTPELGHITEKFKRAKHQSGGPIRTRDIVLVWSLLAHCLEDHMDDNYQMCYAVLVQSIIVAHQFCKPERKVDIFKSREFEGLCFKMFPAPPAKHSQLHLRRGFDVQIYGKSSQNKTTHARSLLQALETYDGETGVDHFTAAVQDMAATCTSHNAPLLLSLMAVQQRLVTMSPSSTGKILWPVCLAKLKWVTKGDASPYRTFICALPEMIHEDLLSNDHLDSQHLLELLKSLYKQVKINPAEFQTLWQLFNCLPWREGQSPEVISEMANFILQRRTTAWKSGPWDNMSSIISAAVQVLDGEQMSHLFGVVGNKLQEVCKLLAASLQLISQDAISQRQRAEELRLKLSGAFLRFICQCKKIKMKSLLECLKDRKSQCGAEIIANYWLLSNLDAVQVHECNSADLHTIVSSLGVSEFRPGLCQCLSTLLRHIHVLLGNKLVATSTFIVNSSFLRDATVILTSSEVIYPDITLPDFQDSSSFVSCYKQVGGSAGVSL